MARQATNRSPNGVFKAISCGVRRVESGSQRLAGHQETGQSGSTASRCPGGGSKEGSEPFLEMTFCAPALEKWSALPLSGSL